MPRVDHRLPPTDGLSERRRRPALMIWTDEDSSTGRSSTVSTAASDLSPLSANGHRGFRYDVIFVSPHVSDVVYSCAAQIRRFVKEGKKVLLLTVFTGRPTPESIARDHAGLDAFLDSEKRISEDEVVMEMLGIDYQYLNIPELWIRKEKTNEKIKNPGIDGNGGPGFYTWAMRNMQALFEEKAETTRLIFDIHEELRELVRRSGCKFVIGPSAMGLHPDSLIVYRAVRQLTDRCRVWFYYDFPSCTSWFLRFSREFYLDARRNFRKISLGPIRFPQMELGFRKDCLLQYESLAKTIFGSEDKLMSAVDHWPQEKFLEAPDVPRAVGLPTPLVKENLVTARVVWKFAVCCDIFVSTTMAVWFHYRCVAAAGDSECSTVGLASVLNTDPSLLHVAMVISLWRIFRFWRTAISYRNSRLLCIISMVVSIFGLVFTDREHVPTLFFIFQIMISLVAGFVREPLVANYTLDPNQGLRVLVISDYAPPQKHSTANRVQCAVRSLRSSGCEVDVYTVSSCANVEDGYYPMPSMPINPWNTAMQFTICPSVKLCKELMFCNWDVLHLYGPSVICWPVMILCWLNGVPVYHCMYVDLKSHVGNYDVIWPSPHEWYSDYPKDGILAPPSPKTPGNHQGDFDHPEQMSLFDDFKAATFHHPYDLVRLLGVRVCMIWVVCLVVEFVVFLLPTFLFADTIASASLDLMQTHWLFQHSIEQCNNPNRTVVIPSSVDDSIYHPHGRQKARTELRDELGITSSATIWLHVGYIGAEQDLDELLQAFLLRNTVSQTDDACLIIAGDGPRLSAIKEKARSYQRLGLPVVFLGCVTDEEAAELYRAADVHITTTRLETSGLAVLEAMACGVPCVMPKEIYPFQDLYGKVVSKWFYHKGDIHELIRTIKAAGAPSQTILLEKLRTSGGFGRDIFWSWKDAMVEQIAQYRRMHQIHSESRRRVNSYIRFCIMLVFLIVGAWLLSTFHTMVSQNFDVIEKFDIISGYTEDDVCTVRESSLVARKFSV